MRAVCDVGVSRALLCRFAGFDWTALYEKRLPAPIVPKIKSPEDTSNFDDYPDDDKVPPYQDNGTDWDADF